MTLGWQGPDGGTVMLNAGPAIPVKEGWTYKFMYDIMTRSGDMIPKGSVLTVMKQTSESPYDETGPYGHNWLCRTILSTTIWSTVEQCIQRGVLVRVDAYDEMFMEEGDTYVMD